MVTLLSFIHTLLLFVIAFPLQFFAKAAAYSFLPRLPPTASDLKVLSVACRTMTASYR